MSMADRLRQGAEESGTSIFCSRGCSHCCKMFVVASLQECEAIVHHLYHNEPALKLFLRNFARWNERILKIESSFININTIHAKMTPGRLRKSR